LSWQFLAVEGGERGARAVVEHGVDAESARADLHALSGGEVGAAAQDDAVADAGLQAVRVHRVRGADDVERDPDGGERFPGFGARAAAMRRAMSASSSDVSILRCAFASARVTGSSEGGVSRVRDIISISEKIHAETRRRGIQISSATPQLRVSHLPR
jgi:hypothetical protein